MADLDNLLDDINDDDSLNDDIDDQQQYYDGDENDNDRQPTIPAALAAAAARRRQMDEDEYGAGEEEHDFQASSGREPDEEEDDDNEHDQNINPDYEQLKGLWTSELACPELLPADAETIAINTEELNKKEEIIEELLQRSKTQQRQREASGEVASLVAQITKMDMDRTRFMLVDLARTRMAKIENHALHNRTLIDRMTEEERVYLQQYGELLEKHYRRTVLDHLPKEAWKKLDEPEMIDSPNLEQFVFCRVLDETVSIDVNGETSALNDDLADNDEDDYAGDNIQDHAGGSYLIVMYKQVKDLVLEGKVELLM